MPDIAPPCRLNVDRENGKPHGVRRKNSPHSRMLVITRGPSLQDPPPPLVLLNALAPAVIATIAATAAWLAVRRPVT